MSLPVYVLKRILSSIPLLLVISVISFSIIRLNITIRNINLSLLSLILISFFLFYLLTKIKNWYFLGFISLISLISFSYYLSSFEILPFPFILSFILLSLFLFLYWVQSFVSKSFYLPYIVMFISLIVVSSNFGFKYPVNIPIKSVVLKSGDPLAELRFNPAISTEVLKLEEKRLGLNEPWHIQYLLWLKGLFHGDLGVTQQNQSVSKVIQKPVINTLLLSLCTLFSTWFIAIPLGIWAALNRNKFIDKFLAILTSCSMSTPTFILAVLGLLFALNSQVLPIGGLTSVSFYEMNLFEKIFDLIKHLILPTTILTLVSISGLQRQMRANLLDVLRQEYIKTAIAKGLPQNMVIYKHALRNAINPLITIFGFEFGALLSGAALTETILAYPGLGALTLEAARKMDINLTMVTLMMGATMLIAGNLIADLLLKFADPRIKFEN
ncbi:MAG: ABC transporter permease [Candidatus Melainabacteria bacterium]|nr:ABC transporter permease [Candidatus Melainabacteria bacterium]